MLPGVDVSNNNGPYKWTAGGFGIVKATEGAFFKDSLFPQNWSAMSTLGVLRGAYHFGHPGTPADIQASYFVSYVKAHGLESADILALDIEVSDGLPAAKVSAWAVEFCTAVEKATSKNVWIYTNHAYISEGYVAGLEKHPLWIADPSSPEGKPADVHPWPVWVVHQYGSIGGVDRDVLNGDATVWKELANLVPSVKYKTVTGYWDCMGQLSLVELCKTGFGGTAVPGLMASTVLRLTLDNSPNQVFPGALAAYISAGDLVKAKVPKGVRLFYAKRVEV